MTRGKTTTKQKSREKKREKKIEKVEENVHDKFLRKWTCKESKSAEAESNQVEEEKKFMRWSAVVQLNK